MKLFVRAAVVVLTLSGSAAFTQMELHPSNHTVTKPVYKRIIAACDPNTYPNQCVPQ